MTTEGHPEKHCTKKSCRRPHKWWSRKEQKYYFCWRPYNR